MNWKTFLKSIILSLPLFGLSTFWFVRALETFGIEPVSCGTSIIIFIRGVKINFLVMILYSFLVMISFYTGIEYSMNLQAQPPLQKIFTVGFISISALLLLAWLFLLTYAGVILFYNRNICEEAKEFITLYFWGCSAITALILIGSGFVASVLADSMNHYRNEHLIDLQPTLPATDYSASRGRG